VSKSDRKPSAVTKHFENYWAKLSDTQLLSVLWETADPSSLPNIQEAIPANLDNFEIECEYHLSPADKEVRCGHCPHHTRHRHGYVLIDDRQRRFLLGSQCGPEAYGADFLVAARGRKDAQRRSNALGRLNRIASKIPNIIEELKKVRQSGTYRLVKRARAETEGRAGAILGHLRRLRPDPATGRLELRVMSRTRNIPAEEKRRIHYTEEVNRLADLPIGNREHARLMGDLKMRMTPDEPIWIESETFVGTLQCSDWLLGAESPTEHADRLLTRLQATVAVAANTTIRTTVQLEREARAAEDLLSGAERVLVTLKEVSTFFEPGNLKSLVYWYGNDGDKPGEMEIDGEDLILRIRHEEVTLIKPRLD
jgi:hypothetical protein